MKTLLIIITLDTGEARAGVGVVDVESWIFNTQQRTGTIDCQIKRQSYKKPFLLFSPLEGKGSGQGLLES